MVLKCDRLPMPWHSYEYEWSDKSLFFCNDNGPNYAGKGCGIEDALIIDIR